MARSSCTAVIAYRRTALAEGDACKRMAVFIDDGGLCAYLQWHVYPHRVRAYERTSAPMGGSPLGMRNSNNIDVESDDDIHDAVRKACHLGKTNVGFVERR